MLIICEKCNASYSIPSEQIGMGGRKVKCAKCAYIWFAKNSTPKPIITAPTEDKKPDVISMPMAIKTDSPIKSKLTASSLPLLMRIICLLLFIIAILAPVFLFYPQFSKQSPVIAGLYQKLGYNSASKIIISDLSVHKIQHANHIDLAFKGNIYNNGSKAINVPALRILVKDAHQKELLNHIINSSGACLKPGEKIILDNIIKKLDNKAVFLQLDLGNGLEFLTR